MKPILFVVGDGIGNQVETVPAFLYCRKVFPNPIWVYNSIPTQTKITKILFRSAEKIFLSKYEKGVYRSNEEMKKHKYRFQILTYACHGTPASYSFINKRTRSGIPIHNRMMLNMRKEFSEVLFNLKSIDNNFSDKDFLKSGKVLSHIKKGGGIPDILMHDGYSKTSDESQKRWEAKSYPKYRKLADILIGLGYTVGSLGCKSERVKGTKNFTGLSLEQTISAIKGTRLLISNDTGTYHLANMIGVPNIVLFTFTDMKKNYEKKFHIYAHPLRREDLQCSPCQLLMGYDFWQINKEKCKWQCRNIDMGLIISKCKEILS